ncbi:MAG: FMN-binding glutamate synthase family protein [Pseudomonadota bacterium]
MEIFTSTAVQGLNLLGSLFLLLVGAGLAAVVVLFVLDIRQTEDAIRHNFPVLGRFRDFFSTLGEFFRQYFFAFDREEMPFNRAERDWIYASAKGELNTQPFGSTRNLTVVGTPIFVNGPFPVLDEEASDPPPVLFGPYAREPYEQASLVNVSAMSYGSLSKPAVQTISKGAKLASCWMNTGEGGLSPFHLEGGCDIIFQIGTAKYSVRTRDGRLDEDRLRDIAATPQVKMIEIKLAQGAKPGKGGILPAEKVTDEIAAIRGIPAHEASISPNRHPEINSTEDLLDFVARVREISGLPTGFKTVLGSHQWLDELCNAIDARGLEAAPDFITVDGGDGGTGAAPLALIDNVGLPLKHALPMLADVLERRGLRDRIKIICSGKLVTPAEVAWAYCAGADVVNTGRGFMFALGCIQALRCNTNECPTGITTHQKRYQRGLDVEEKSARVANYVRQIRKDVNIIAHSCGAPHARALRRHHVRMVQADGVSEPLDVLCDRMARVHGYRADAAAAAE